MKTKGILKQVSSILSSSFSCKVLWPPLDEDRLREALKFANACGALTVTERGAIPALPTREAVLNALLNVIA
ncbi:hypothetical protein M5K25_004146 [Dendrobium thyrsiflorum]|uniref:Uncharacterized protein n=1 Tax=Dendrobium thyrsiflorum TaxID=117978 RepID=A0ABD0VTC3_DENTH